MTDVLAATSEFSWRGTEYPLLRASHGFAHAQAETRLIYRNGQFIEQLGADVLWCKYTVPMREDITVGPFANLFSTGFLKLFEDMQNTEPGDLVDPVYGPLTMVPGVFSDTLDPQKRDGLDVELEFKVYQELGDELTVTGPSLSGLARDAARLDDEVEAVARAAQVPSPEPATDPLSAIAGVGAQLNRSRDRVKSSLANVSAKLRKIERQVDELEDPLNGDIIREARRLRVDAARLSEKAEPNRVARRTLTNVAKSLVEVARDVGATLEELIQLNPSLVKSPTVPAGTSVTYYGR